MKRRRNRIPCDRNNRWYDRYENSGYFCLPRDVLFSMVDLIDNATVYVYIAAASCHFENNTTFAGPHIARLTGKDESAVRGHLADLETLGLIAREPLGRGYKILFQCPTRARIKKGAAVLAKRRQEALERRKRAKKGSATPVVEVPTLLPVNELPYMDEIWSDE